MDINKFRFKVVVIGDPGVGKTSLVTRFVLNKFYEDSPKTFGTRLHKKVLTINVEGVEELITLMIWDIMGEKEFDKILHRACEGAQGALVVCDLTCKESIINIDKWIRLVYESAGVVPITIIANKCDLNDEYAFPLNDLNKLLSEKHSLSISMTSAKTGEQVKEVFQSITTDINLITMDLKEFPKLKRRVTVNEEGKILYTIKNLEDDIMIIFCEYFGGLEKAMPILRVEYLALKIDFTSPSMEDLKFLIRSLEKVISEDRNEEKTRVFYEKISEAMARYESQEGLTLWESD